MNSNATLTISKRPSLRSKRLLLRPFLLADAPDVQRLAGDKAIAATTANIPHPYEDGVAEEWIGKHPEQFEQGKAVHLAISDLRSQRLFGAIGLTISAEHRRAELGYWIGRLYWSNGYCTEAARAVLAYAFDSLALNRVTAQHFLRNPASGCVMQKIGMTREGHLRAHIKKWDKFEDVICYGILQSQYADSASTESIGRT